MVQAPQLVVALARLAELVQACPDPEAWAASLTASRDFAFVIQKVELFLPTMDALQLREAICALASLRVRQPALLMALGEQVSSHLHVLNSTDAARCLWAFCTLSLLQAPAYPKMMRSLEKHLASLPAELLCQLVQAIVPLGRSAACSRLLPKLCLVARLTQPRTHPGTHVLVMGVHPNSRRLPALQLAIGCLLQLGGQHLQHLRGGGGVHLEREHLNPRAGGERPAACAS